MTIISRLSLLVMAILMCIAPAPSLYSGSGFRLCKKIIQASWDYLVPKIPSCQSDRCSFKANFISQSGNHSIGSLCSTKCMLTTSVLAGTLIAGGYYLWNWYTSCKQHRAEQDIRAEQSVSEEFDVLKHKSYEFNERTPFPTKTNKTATIAGSDTSKKAIIVEHARNTRPIICKRVMYLIRDFLDHKRIYGTDIEKALYALMDEQSFIDRLLVKRPLMFMKDSDYYYLLRDGSRGKGGFEAIGTYAERAPLVLQEYLSYDEMQIAALLGVSVPTYFINDGNRFNKAIPDISGLYQEQGVYVGLVGACFEKPGRMEWQHMIVRPEQNTPANGYAVGTIYKRAKADLLAIWSRFYGVPFQTFQQAKNDTSGRYIKIGPDTYLDTVIYKERMKVVLDPFLAEANERGKQAKKMVYCHIVGLGLGVWQKTPQQAQLMLEVYADIIKTRNLSYISDLDFSWFPKEYATCDGVGHLQKLRAGNNTITIHFSQRNPADKLVNNDADKLLVAMYAWDGNAYPGNEYWAKQLDASGDPAAACCSTIAELQNPLINSHVSSKNLLCY